MSEGIPLSVPYLGGKEWDYVKECLDTGWVSSAGSFVTRFERELASWVRSQHAVACSNGTAALHVSLRMAGVQPGDLVLAPTLTFVASVNAVRYLGADPVFFDCDQYYNLSPEPVIAFLTDQAEKRDGGLIHKDTGRRIGALVCVHVFGNAGRWWDLFEFVRSLGLPVVDDATEALGTWYREGPWAGTHAGTQADLGCFSFNGNKIITTGGGGMIVTGSSALADRARYLTQQAKDDPVGYRHDEVGYNYRLTNLAAALGVAQLEQLSGFVERKRAISAGYQERLSDLDWCHLREPPPYASNNCWLNALYVREGPWRGRIRALTGRLREKGVEVRPVWQLNHTQRPYRDCLCVGSETANDLAGNTVNLPSSVGLTDEQLERVCEELRRA